MEDFKIKVCSQKLTKNAFKVPLQNWRIQSNFFYSMLDILMQGEMKDWNDEVPIGEVYNSDFELFRNSEDTNIQMLVKVGELVDQTYHSLKNINGIETEEEEE